MLKTVRAINNWKGVLEKDKIYTITEEQGIDWNRLVNGIYVPSFILEVVNIEENKYEDEEYDYFGERDREERESRYKSRSKVMSGRNNKDKTRNKKKSFNKNINIYARD